MACRYSLIAGGGGMKPELCMAYAIINKNNLGREKSLIAADDSEHGADVTEEISVATELEGSVASEANGLARFIELLAMLDTLRGFARLGYSSIFEFCTEHLHLTHGEAATRVRLAKLFQRESRVLDVLSRGAVGMCALRILSPILTPENFDEVMIAAKGRSARDLESMRNGIQGANGCPHTKKSRVQFLDFPADAEIGAATETATASGASASGVPIETLAMANQSTMAQCDDNTTAAAQKMVRVSAVITHDVWIKYERACALANTGSGATNLAEMFEKIVDAFLEKEAKRRGIKLESEAKITPTIPEHSVKKEKHKVTAISGALRATISTAENTDQCATASRTEASAHINTPFSGVGTELLEAKVDTCAVAVDTCAVEYRQNSEIGNSKKGKYECKFRTSVAINAHSRYIPRAVAAEVWQRDKGQCTYVSALSGRRCQCRRGLQIDHIVPFARGGSSSRVSNLRLLCPQHNRLAADDIFGRKFMKAAEKKGRRCLIDDS
jgi:5-methylcytosine-specific restriction endonuclease McrA